MAKITQKITPFLWFDTQAEEAVKFYTSIFKNSKVGSTTRYDEEGAKVSGRPKGSVMTVEFELAGQEFTALNGGPLFKFTEADLFCGELRKSAGSRRFLGEALCGRTQKSMRLAQRQIRPFLAGCPDHPNRVPARQGPGESQTRHARHAPNEQTRRSKVEAGVRTTVRPKKTASG